MTSPNEKQRVIPACVYDAIKAQAEIHGGVGVGSMYIAARPCCGIGLAHAGGAFPGVAAGDALYTLTDDGIAAGFSWMESDAAVDRVLFREDNPRFSNRITFEEWIKELNAVRGDDQ